MTGRQELRIIAKNELEVELEGGPIANGGLSDVFRARWAQPDRREWLAVKVFRRLCDEDDPEVLNKLQTRLKRELTAWSNIPTHDNILPFVGLYTHDDDRIRALVSPYRPSGDILHYMKTYNPRSINRRQLAIGVITGLVHLHSNNIIHGDFSPKNVLIHIDDKGNPCPQIADFGRAKALDFSNFEGSLMGNVRYSAPEVILELGASGTNEVLTKYSDVWSLGMVLLHVMSGIEPFVGLSPPGIVILLHKREELSPSNYLMSNCPVNTKVWPILQSCWRIDSEREARCSAKECLSAFEALYDTLLPPQDGELEEAIAEPLESFGRLNGNGSLKAAY